MDFQVPQFIERESKIVGPFTLKQFIYIGVAGIISFVLYFRVSTLTFAICTSILTGIALSLALIKVGNQTLPVIIKNLFLYLISSKIYLWKPKRIGMVVGVKKDEEIKPKNQEDEPLLSLRGKSHLQNLSRKIETK